MPTIFSNGPYRFFFYAGDRDEPIQVHLERDDSIAKFWIETIRLQRSSGFRSADLKRIRRIIEEKQDDIVECWNEYFNDWNSAYACGTYLYRRWVSNDRLN